MADPFPTFGDAIKVTQTGGAYAVHDSDFWVRITNANGVHVPNRPLELKPQYRGWFKVTGTSMLKQSNAVRAASALASLRSGYHKILATSHPIHELVDLDEGGLEFYSASLATYTDYLNGVDFLIQSLFQHHPNVDSFETDGVYDDVYDLNVEGILTGGLAGDPADPNDVQDNEGFTGNMTMYALMQKRDVIQAEIDTLSEGIEERENLFNLLMHEKEQDSDTKSVRIASFYIEVDEILQIQSLVAQGSYRMSDLGRVSARPQLQRVYNVYVGDEIGLNLNILWARYRAMLDSRNKIYVVCTDPVDTAERIKGLFDFLSKTRVRHDKLSSRTTRLGTADHVIGDDLGGNSSGTELDLTSCLCDAIACCFFGETPSSNGVQHTMAPQVSYRRTQAEIARVGERRADVSKWSVLDAASGQPADMTAGVDITADLSSSSADTATQFTSRSSLLSDFTTFECINGKTSGYSLAHRDTMGGDTHSHYYVHRQTTTATTEGTMLPTTEEQEGADGCLMKDVVRNAYKMTSNMTRADPGGQSSLIKAHIRSSTLTGSRPATGYAMRNFEQYASSLATENYSYTFATPSHGLTDAEKELLLGSQNPVTLSTVPVAALGSGTHYYPGQETPYEPVEDMVARFSEGYLRVLELCGQYDPDFDGRNPTRLQSMRTLVEEQVGGELAPDGTYGTLSSDTIIPAGGRSSDGGVFMLTLSWSTTPPTNGMVPDISVTVKKSGSAAVNAVMVGWNIQLASQDDYNIFSDEDSITVTQQKSDIIDSIVIEIEEAYMHMNNWNKACFVLSVSRNSDPDNVAHAYGNSFQLLNDSSGGDISTAAAQCNSIDGISGNEATININNTSVPTMFTDIGTVIRVQTMQQDCVVVVSDNYTQTAAGVTIKVKNFNNGDDVHLTALVAETATPARWVFTKVGTVAAGIAAGTVDLAEPENITSSDIELAQEMRPDTRPIDRDILNNHSSRSGVTGPTNARTDYSADCLLNGPTAGFLDSTADADYKHDYTVRHQLCLQSGDRVVFSVEVTVEDGETGRNRRPFLFGLRLRNGWGYTAPVDGDETALAYGSSNMIRNRDGEPALNDSSSVHSQGSANDTPPYISYEGKYSGWAALYAQMCRKRFGAVAASNAAVDYKISSATAGTLSNEVRIKAEADGSAIPENDATLQAILGTDLMANVIVTVGAVQANGSLFYASTGTPGWAITIMAVDVPSNWTAYTADTVISVGAAPSAGTSGHEAYSVLCSPDLHYYRSRVQTNANQQDGLISFDSTDSNAANTFHARYTNEGAGAATFAASKTADKRVFNRWRE